MVNTNDKADDFIREDDNFIPQQVDDIYRYDMNRVYKLRKIQKLMKIKLNKTLR